MADETEWRKRTDENGDRNYQFFSKMFPELNDEIIDKFMVGFGATILYEDMSREEIGKLIYNAIAIGFVSGKQQSVVASAVWDQAVEACISRLSRLATVRAEKVGNSDAEWALQSAKFALEELKRSQSQTGTDDSCQAKSSAKGETVSAAPLQASLGAEAMRHLGTVLSFFADLDEDDRCRAFTDALEFFNGHHPESQIQGEPGFTWYICQRSPLGFNCRHQIEERSDEVTAASAERSLTHKINQESDNG
jgi:hypothetical protein